MDEPGVAAECPPEQKEKEQEGAGASEGGAGGGAGDRDLPTTDGVTTGATSAVAVTIKNNPDTVTATAGGASQPDLEPGPPPQATPPPPPPQKVMVPPAIVNHPPAFHLDHSAD